MTLRILFLPLVIVISLAAAIFYIKPEIDTVFSKRSTLDQKNADLASADDKLRHVDALVQDLDRNKDSEDLVLHYLPNMQKDDQMVALLQYIASQSSISINSAVFKKVAESKLPEPTNSDQPQDSSVIFATDSNGSNNNDLAARIQNERPKKVEVEVVLYGSYESIRSYIQKVARADSFQEITAIDIKKNSASPNNTPDVSADPNVLKGTVDITFSYFPKRKLQNMIHSPVFSQDALSYKTVSDLRQFITSSVPEIQVGASGKSNPFLP